MLRRLDLWREMGFGGYSSLDCFVPFSSPQSRGISDHWYPSVSAGAIWMMPYTDISVNMITLFVHSGAWYRSG